MAEISYKVLVADDEYWTREKIRNMLNWQEYHMEFLEPAQDGEEVLARMESDSPDILITDINMPFVNGVELVEQVKEKYEDVVIFVISGYDDFEYVKRTLVAGAINYLLKPVTKIDLVNALSKALEIISRQKENKNLILKAASLIQDSELSILLEREEPAFVPSITMNGNMDFAGCSLMLIKIHDMKAMMKEYQYDRNYLSYTLKKKIRDVMDMDNLLIFNYLYRSNEFVIITESENEEQKKMVVKILGIFREMTDSPVSIIVSEHSYSMESIHSAYTQCISMLMTRKYKKESAILFSRKQDESVHRKLEEVISEEMENKLKSLLKTGNAAGIRQTVFETLGIRHSEKEEWEYIRVKQMVRRVCNLFMDYQTRQNVTKDIIDLENMMEMADKTIESLDVEKLCGVLEEVIQSIVNMPGEEAGGSIREMVRESVAYIDANFFEELSLASLSERFGVESSYYSRIFRQETGKNLMLYIAEKRVCKAKEYMQDATINLAEVAFMVGYDDYTYFNRVFRKMTGISPRDYRNSVTESRAYEK